MAEKETARLEAFSDGVFAFAVTLLVLNVLDDAARVMAAAHDAQSSHVVGELGSLWHEYVALMLTFGTVYVLWMAHHAAFQKVHHLDGRILLANGVLLLLVSTSPLPTAVLADAMGSGGRASTWSAVAYAAYFFLVSLAFLLLGYVIARSQRVGLGGFTDLELRQLRWRARFGTAAYLAALAAAFVNAWVTVVICGLLWIFWAWVAFARHRHTHAEDHEHGASS